MVVDGSQCEEMQESIRSNRREETSVQLGENLIFQNEDIPKLTLAQ
jgi:hypothetical protein